MILDHGSPEPMVDAVRFNILLHVDPRHALFNMQTAPIMHFLINHARILIKSVQRSMVSSVGSAEPWFRKTFSFFSSRGDPHRLRPHHLL